MHDGMHIVWYSGSTDGNGSSKTVRNWSESPLCVKRRWYAPCRDTQEAEPRNGSVHHCFQGLLLTYLVKKTSEVIHGNLVLFQVSLVVTFVLKGDRVALLVGHRTCDLLLLVPILTGHHCIVALGKLTPVCLCHQAVYLGTGQGGWSLWLGNNRGPGGKWQQPTTGFITKSPAGWLPRNPGSAVSPAVVIEPLLTYHKCEWVCRCLMAHQHIKGHSVPSTDVNWSAVGATFGIH